jgi:hypothetical protein
MSQVPVDHDVIEQLARAVIGQLSPLSGTRGTGRVLVVNDTASAITLEKNMYLLPNVGTLGELADDLVFKTRPNPDTLEAHGEGGVWTIPANDELEVDVWSNLGGARHNLPAGTTFRWDPPLTGLGPTCTLVDAITDAANKPDLPRLDALVYYEDLDSAKIAKDLAAGRISTPGGFLIWEGSTPTEGRTASTNQGSTRADSERRFFCENYRIFVAVSDHSSDRERRGGGVRLLQGITRFLSDQQVTSDFEQLTGLGALEITGRSRFIRGERHYVYQLAFRVNRVIRRLDTRSFIPWLQTHIVASAPGREAPEPTTPFVMADVTDPNPPGPP